MHFCFRDFELGFDVVFLLRVLVQDLGCFLAGLFELKGFLLVSVRGGEGGAWTSSSSSAFCRREDLLTGSLPLAISRPFFSFF